MPVPPSEKEKSHEEDLIKSSKLSLESWDPKRRIHLNRRSFVFASPEVMKKFLVPGPLFLSLDLLGSRILVVPSKDERGISGRGAVYSAVVKCTYPLEFKEAIIEISRNHERIKFIQEGTEPQELFTTHLGERDGIIFDLAPGQILTGGIRTPSPLRVVLKSV